MKLTTAKSKSIVSGVLIAASLAFTASTAMAAATPAHKTAAATHHVVHTSHVAAVRRGPAGWQQPSLAQFFGLFGLPIPVAATAHAARGTVSSGSGGYDPTFDSPSAAVEVDNSQSQAAIDAADQAEQQVDQDTFQMDESVINTEAQDDASNAALQQDLVNNGM